MNNTPQQQFEGALGWDSQISQESSFVILPAGEYDFKVEKMERGSYNPSPNSSIRDISPQAELELTVYSPDGQTATVYERLILHSKMEWKISEFFISIGQKKPGEPLVPNWSFVPGSTGRCEIEINKYTNKQGQERENNRVARFLEPTQQAPSYQQYQTPQQPVQQPMQQQVPQQQASVQQQTPPANPGFEF